MAFTKYPSGTIVINGTFITETKDITVTWNPALNPVVTQAGRGFSQGAKTMTVTGTFAIPSIGAEINPSAFANRGEIVLVQFFIANGSLQTKGMFTATEIGSSVEGETTWSYTLDCDYAELET